LRSLLSKTARGVNERPAAVRQLIHQSRILPHLPQNGDFRKVDGFARGRMVPSNFWRLRPWF
jgi:hypothetical protein